MVELSDRQVRLLEPHTERYEVDFEECPELRLYVSPRGLKTWYFVDPDRGDDTAHRSLGVFPQMNAAQAREAVRRLRAGEAPLPATPVDSGGSQRLLLVGGGAAALLLLLAGTLSVWQLMGSSPGPTPADTASDPGPPLATDDSRPPTRPASSADAAAATTSVASDHRSDAETNNQATPDESESASEAGSSARESPAAEASTGAADAPAREMSAGAADTASSSPESDVVAASEEDRSAAGATPGSSTAAGPESAPATREPADTAGEEPARVGGIARSRFTSNVANREPVDDLGDRIRAPRSGVRRIYYFTEITDLAGVRVRHRWEYAGEVVAEVPLEIGSHGWRTFSSKNVMATQLGPWRVSVLRPDGARVGADTFTLVAPE